jgi:hypothetical protein
MTKTLAVFVLALAVLAPTTPSFAKEAEEPKTEVSEQDQLALLRASIRIDKRNFLKDSLDLDESEAPKFWSIYHQYEAELIKLNDNRQALIKDYADHFEDVTEAKADELVKKALAYHKARLSLMEKYYGKVAKALSKRLGARFLQVENVLHGAGDVTIGTSIPLIPKVQE